MSASTSPEQAPLYRRKEREGPLSFSTKFYQGIGAIPDTIKNLVFNTFVLLFYNQILGVEPVLVSVALAISVAFDAITDPVVATLSDHAVTRYGRRHPLMLISALPLGACLYAVFVPPAGFSEMQLFGWLLAFTLLTRGFMTLYFVPWSAIAAELSDDYFERTSVMAFRFAVGWLVGGSFPLFVYIYIMPATPEFPAGQLNPAGYAPMALLAGCMLSAGALATTLLTWREIPYLRQPPPNDQGFGLGQTLSDLKEALRNPQYALIFSIVLISSAIAGTTANLGIYMTTFFWGLTTEDLRWFAFIGFGALAAFPFVAVIQKRWDKKHILITCSTVSLFEGVALVTARFLDLLPANGDPMLLYILIGFGNIAAAIAVVQGIIAASIVADLVDDQELRTGLRQEGMFNAGLSFSGKAVTGLGTLMGGLILTLIEFPMAAKTPDSVPMESIRNLGIVVGVIVPLFYLIPISLISRYQITRQRHAEIRRALEIRNHRPHVPEGESEPR